jgi:hypothetical protein
MEVLHIPYLQWLLQAEPMCDENWESWDTKGCLAGCMRHTKPEKSSNLPMPPPLYYLIADMDRGGVAYTAPTMVVAS